MPPAGEHELLGQTIGGRYRIKGILGEGGMGTVYDAEHLGLGREVAIKVLSPSQAKKRVSVKRFQQEARAAGGIGHPNICEVYDLGALDSGSPYLVMEKLVGQTLADRIAREGGLPFDEVVDVLRQVLSGLIAAHEKGILHRDIKPENIFLARRLGCPPIVKLLDFGVSKMMPEFQTGEDAFDLTRTGMVMGTPYYMSPEQARGERTLDGRVDVYACGVVMYESIAGKRPFTAPNYNALLLAIINTPPRSLREHRPATPPDLEAIVRRAMAKNRADRYGSAKHFLRDLSSPGAPVVEGSGARLPEVDERRRAASHAQAGHGQNLASTRGGRRVTSPAGQQPPREPLDQPERASATLRARMTEGSRTGETGSPSDRFRPARESHELIRPQAAAFGTGDSIEIPIHVSGPESVDVDLPIDDEDATAVFQPNRHRGPHAPTPLPKTLRGAVPPRGHGPSNARSAHPWSLAGDDLDNTIVASPDVIARARPAAPRSEERPFNPDETIALDNTGDIEIVEEYPIPPRRR